MLARFILSLLSFLAMQASAAGACLPQHDHVVTITAKNSVPAYPDRALTLYLCYPEGSLSAVTPSTGVMLSLHNWGGRRFDGAPDPARLATSLNCIVIGVDYFQSGTDAEELPYDHGLVQALDALQALHYVIDKLQLQGVAFAGDRIYAVGGSGGGNVSLMANKLAPHTFTLVVDISGMKSLTDDIAFGEDGGSHLNARYSREIGLSNWLSPDAKEIRDSANPNHLRLMEQWGTQAKIISVHGVTDASCLFSDAEAYACRMKAAGLDFQFVTVDSSATDGEIFTSTDHALGDRTAILLHVAGKYLFPESPQLGRRPGGTDFDRKSMICYPTQNGEWVIDYSDGAPFGLFRSAESN